MNNQSTNNLELLIKAYQESNLKQYVINNELVEFLSFLSKNQYWLYEIYVNCVKQWDIELSTFYSPNYAKERNMCNQALTFIGTNPNFNQYVKLDGDFDLPVYSLTEQEVFWLYFKYKTNRTEFVEFTNKKLNNLHSIEKRN